jgi:hypothetical protein
MRSITDFRRPSGDVYRVYCGESGLICREKDCVVEEASQMQRNMVALQAELSAACKDKAELALECVNLRTAVSLRVA